MTITVRVYNAVATFPGLYKWDYEVTNVSINSDYPDAAVNGIGELDIYIPGDLGDVGNVYTPSNWQSGAPEFFANDGNTYLWVASQLGPDPIYPWNPSGQIYALQPGQTMHFGFTTFPRQVTTLQPCSPDDGINWGDGTYRLNACGIAYKAEALYPMIAHPVTLGVTKPNRKPNHSAVGIAKTVGLTSGHMRPLDADNPEELSGSLAVPGPPLTNLQSFQWNASSDGNPLHGMISLYHDSANNNWSDDALADEGDTQVAQPAWVEDSSGDGAPTENDPVAYTGGTIPSITNIVLTRADGITASAVLRVTADSGGLAFPDTPIQFVGGAANLTGPIIAQTALPAAIANLGVDLTWSISFDQGQTWTGFAETNHNVFVTLGNPEGFDGGTSLVSSPHITAARVNYVTMVLSGQTDPDASAQIVQGWISTLFATGASTLADLYQNNPWAALDQPSTTAGLDCYSLTAIGAVQLLQAGIDVSVAVAYPTTDGDATTQESQDDPQTSNQTDALEYYLQDGVTLNLFEAFLTLNQSGQAVDAYLFFPVAGPLQPWQSPPVDGLPSTGIGQLAFRVIYQELAFERSLPQNPQSGQQWWINNSTGLPAQGPVAFPVSIQ